MDDRLLIVREVPLRDLIDLSRQAADALRDRIPDDPLARALDGVVAEVSTDTHEAARLRSICPVRAY